MGLGEFSCGLRVECDTKLATHHAKTLHALSDVGCEFLRCFASQLAKLRGDLAPFGRQTIALGRQQPGMLLECFEAFEFNRELGEHGGQALGCDAVLACERFDGG